ncbi:MAG: hypothetical protein KME26_19245 [Oscillatoria princeps RMCB-10]|nr:hypothetical protein [Oscillatoria princeps RMCB-10]
MPTLLAASQPLHGTSASAGQPSLDSGHRNAGAGALLAGETHPNRGNRLTLRTVFFLQECEKGKRQGCYSEQHGEQKAPQQMRKFLSWFVEPFLEPFLENRNSCRSQWDISFEFHIATNKKLVV